MNKKTHIFVGDFETTVFQGQEYTEVWASALVPIDSEDVIIFNSIGDTFDYLFSLGCDAVVYYHNLKFDGSFWLDYLLRVKEFKQAVIQTGEQENEVKWIKNSRQMPANSFQYMISNMGQWYSMKIKHKGHVIELRDSLKLIPLSVQEIGKAFKTKHQKLEMEYKGFRYAGCQISDEEREYIKNDVLVVKEALSLMFNQGHTALTIGACCMGEFKKLVGSSEYNELFINVYDLGIDEDTYGYKSVGDYIRRSYRGGWCYVVPEKAHKVHKFGVTIDVNSLYPSVMHSMSGCEYPVGVPIMWAGDYIPDEALEPHRYFFIRVKTRFYIKDNYLPFIQIKHNLLYRGTESLKTSDVWDFKRNRYTSFYYSGVDKQIHDTRVILTLTQTDYYLLLEHYNLVDFEILDGCYFRSVSGLFDEYIDKYKKIKISSKGGLRQIAKLFLNNLYGKLASSNDSSFKYAYLDEDGIISYYYVKEYDKKPGYIPIGSAITSYARNFTIRAAQSNYYGAHEPGFIYADTDSLHMDLPIDAVKDAPLHPVEFCHWSYESRWDEAYFTRQKTYIEHVIEADGVQLDKPFYDVKCAGMPKRCKELFVKSMEGYIPQKGDGYNAEEIAFITEKKRELTDFDLGLKVPSKLMPKRIRGGVVLVDTTYEMR